MKRTASQREDNVRAATRLTECDEICFYRANEKPYGAFSNLHRRALVFCCHAATVR